MRVRFSIIYLLIIATTVVTAVVRGCVLYFFSGSLGFEASYPDEANYYLPAANMLIEGGVDFFKSPRSLWNGPLNPLWIAAFGGNVPIVKVANTLLFSLASGVLAGAVGSIAGWRKGALFALGLLAYPQTYSFVPTLLTEPLYISLLMLSFGFVLLLNFSSLGFLGSGVLLGFATLARPTTQLFPLFLLALAIGLCKAPWRHRLVIHSVAALIVCAPTVLWNWTQFGKAGIANGLGAVLYLGNDLRRDGDEPVYYGVDFDTYRITAPSTHLDSDGDAALTKVAVQRIKSRPSQSALLIIRKAFRYLFGSYHGYFWPHNGLLGKIKYESSMMQKCVSLAWPAAQVLVVLAALVALFQGWIAPVLRIYVAAMLMYFTALHAVTFPIPRMFLPLYPYLLVLGAIGMGSRMTAPAARRIFCVSAPLIFAFVCAPRASQFPSESNAAYTSFFDYRYEGAFEGQNDIQKREFDDVIGDDPYLVYRFNGIVLQRSQVVSFHLMTRCADRIERRGNGQIFWAVNNSAFSESSSVQFPLRSGSAIHVVRPALAPNWSGALTSLRIDLPHEFLGCSVRVQNVALLE
jgi:hypothetical protein